MNTTSVKTTLKLQREAAEQGIELIGPGRDPNYRTYRLRCGHTQETLTCKVRSGKFACKTCLHEKHRREASEQGIELIGPGRAAPYRTYRLRCGHEQEFQTPAVRNGIINCRICDNRSWTSPSNLYVIRVTLDDGQSYIKLGYSNNVQKRITEYGLPYYATAAILATAPFSTREEADVAESMLSTRYVEWKIPPTHVDDIFTKSGSTEVYHHSIEESARLFVRDLDFLIRKGK